MDPPNEEEDGGSEDLSEDGPLDFQENDGDGKVDN
jgi:hypothetical protein